MRNKLNTSIEFAAMKTKEKLIGPIVFFAFFGVTMDTQTKTFDVAYEQQISDFNRTNCG